MKSTRPYFIYTIFMVLTMIGPACGQPQAKDKPAVQSVYELLTSTELPKLTLEADFTTIAANKKTNQYFPGILETDKGRRFKVDIKPRGRYRRKIAQIPPLKIKFSKKGLRAEGLDTLNEIKLVLPALDDEQGNDLIIREYLIYRMFESLSPAHVRARLIRLTLTDSHVEQTHKNLYAILVEDEEETAARLNAREVNDYGMPADSLNTNQAALTVIFQYMIGNTDWEISMLRNVRLVRPKEPSSKILVIPYDFDFSGLVAAPYASPASDTGLKSVRDRFLMPNGVKPDALRRAAHFVNVNKQKIYDACKSKYLSRAAYNDMVGYLDVYFQQVAEREEVPQLLKMPITD